MLRTDLEPDIDDGNGTESSINSSKGPQSRIMLGPGKVPSRNKYSLAKLSNKQIKSVLQALENL